MLVNFKMLLVRQFQISAVLAIGASERVGRVVRTVHLRIGQLFIQIPLGHLYRVHRTEFQIKDFFAHGT